MLLRSQSARRLPVVAAAFLLSVALPAAPALAQKTKTKKLAEPAPIEITHSVSIPTIEAVGSNVDEATLKAILSGELVDNANALASLTARSITVPEINISMRAVEGNDVDDMSFVLSELVLTNVVDGVAESISIGGTDMDADEATFAFGAISAANFDIAGVLGLYGLVSSDAPDEMKTIYTDFRAEGGTLVSDEVNCTIGPVSGDHFKARPLKIPMTEIIRLAEQMEENPDKVDPVVMGQFVRVYADMLTAFESSEVTMGGISCDGTDSEDRAMHFGIDGLVMGGMAPGIYPAISVNGVKIEVDGDGEMSLANFTFKEMDLTPTIRALESAPERLDEAWLEANARALIPSFGGFSMSGFSIDIPDPDNAGSRIVADIGAVDLTLANYINGIPSALDASVSNLQAELPEDTGDDSLEMLRSFGVTDIDASARVALAWDEASNSINIEDVSFSGVDLATVRLAGTITNATAALFDENENNVMAAAMGLAVKSLNLDVVDAGLSDLVLAVAAADQGADPATLRPIFAGLAEGTVISLMAGAADAAKLGQAINAFVSGKAKTLQIGLEAKQDPGISIPEFLAAEDDPASLLGKLNVSATAK